MTYILPGIFYIEAQSILLMTKFSLLILTVGIPGSGKSTWAKKYLKKHPLTYLISTDQIRLEMTGTMQCNPEQSHIIHEEARKRVKKIIDDPNNYGGDKGLGPEIIVDSTNVTVEEWIAYKKLGCTLIAARLFDVSVETAMKNQYYRGRIVPRDVVEAKKASLEENKKFMPLVFNMILTN